MKLWLFCKIFKKNFVGFFVLVVVFLVVFFFGLFFVIGWGYFYFYFGKIICVLEFYYFVIDKIYIGILGLVNVVVLFVVIIFCYIKVFLKV